MRASTQAFEAALQAGLGCVPLQLLDELAQDAASSAAQAAEVQLRGNVQQLVPVTGGLMALYAAGPDLDCVCAALLYPKAPSAYEVGASTSLTNCT